MSATSPSDNAVILGIESSCDETAAAIVTSDRQILANVISSSSKIHAAHGGVVPEIAARAHLDTISPVIRECLDKAQLGFDDIDGIGVTSGPGLIGGLMCEQSLPCIIFLYTCITSTIVHVSTYKFICRLIHFILSTSFLPGWVALQIVFRSLALVSIKLPQDEEESAFGGAIHPLSAQKRMVALRI